jgi:hypothetical protein
MSNKMAVVCPDTLRRLYYEAVITTHMPRQQVKSLDGIILGYANGNSQSLVKLKGTFKYEAFCNDYNTYIGWELWTTRAGSLDTYIGVLGSVLCWSPELLEIALYRTKL